MTRYISVQEALERRFKRQKQIEGLTIDKGGFCTHVGEISIGCLRCFSNKLHYNFMPGTECNLNCVYCSSSRPENGVNTENFNNRLKTDLEKIDAFSKTKSYEPWTYSFSGGGEPLLHMQRIHEAMGFLKSIENRTNKKPWYYLYTNGLLAGEDYLKQLIELGFDEIRFHLGASNFAKRVYKNLGKAVRLFDTVTVETPAWQPHRDELFNMLAIINDLGVKHLNLGEIQLGSYSVANRAIKNNSEVDLYILFELHIENSELVYDLIEETIDKKYIFSVLDCSGLVKMLQRSNYQKFDTIDILRRNNPGL